MLWTEETGIKIATRKQQTQFISLRQQKNYIVKGIRYK